ncbi:hypothetical protein O6H91_06G127700 [Diphasiastrum complanatum]|uniref:Uncharacterized protein n=1 Tax=Diphasiastrum complanatum TaxID=34168 RepID=A0ACC2DIH0_DIPCM|nr:hypothetical protein O6H91_06G127700 [Diphasiastrum complanatum]
MQTSKATRRIRFSYNKGNDDHDQSSPAPKKFRSHPNLKTTTHEWALKYSQEKGLFLFISRKPDVSLDMSNSKCCGVITWVYCEGEEDLDTIILTIEGPSSRSKQLFSLNENLCRNDLCSPTILKKHLRSSSNIIVMLGPFARKEAPIEPLSTKMAITKKDLQFLLRSQ